MAAQLSGPGGSSRFDLRQNADINVTPFVDVMLVLLIVMMVSAPLATKSIKVDLPPATPPKPSDPKTKPTFISIRPGNQIFLTGESPHQTSLARLGEDLQASLHVPDARNEVILIQADHSIPYNNFMDVVNQLETDGFYKIGLIVDDPNLGES
jgi:biopolymer transport protein ExbD